jgi:pyrroline-5-carboxylate reductase
MDITLGIIGGSGMLGRAIAAGLLKAGAVPPEQLWVSNRSGSSAGFGDWPGVTFTSDNQSLAGACDVILLCVPPAMAGDIGISAPDKLVLSVMAGVDLERIGGLTGSERVVRAMSSPAAEYGLAFSPWIASPEVTPDDKARVSALFAAIGETAEVATEDQVVLFTALTGPVPGFVAFFAECLSDYAEAHGVAPEVADRATRQLFLSAGRMMAEGKATPRDHVQEMIDYDGTTAAGMRAMRGSSIASEVGKGLDAAVARTRSIG